MLRLQAGCSLVLPAAGVSKFSAPGAILVYVQGTLGCLESLTSSGFVSSILLFGDLVVDILGEVGLASLHKGFFSFPRPRQRSPVEHLCLLLRPGILWAL